MDTKRAKDEKLKAGHYEIHGETIAKFEFFDHGYNPYSRYLDIDKVDLILRSKWQNKISYAEIQVKFGRLYPVSEKWAKINFDFTSWRFMNPEEFKEFRKSLFVAYVLEHPEGYRGDIFIFPSEAFHKLVGSGIASNTKKGKRVKIYIAHCINDNKWYLWKSRNFSKISGENTIDVSEYRRNFDLKVLG